MKKLTQFMMMVGVVVVMSATAYAWQVTVNNRTAERAYVNIVGDHFAWKQTDCEQWIQARSSWVCNMPNIICPIKVEALLGPTLNCAIDNRIPACQNSELNIECNAVKECKMYWMNNDRMFERN